MFARSPYKYVRKVVLRLSSFVVGHPYNVREDSRKRQKGLVEYDGK